MGYELYAAWGFWGTSRGPGTSLLTTAQGNPCPHEGGKRLQCQIAPNLLISHLPCCMGLHSWVSPSAGLGTGSGLGFAHITCSLPRPWAALFSKSRHVSFQVADMERKTHTKTNHRPSFSGWRAARVSLRLEVDAIPVWQRSWRAEEVSQCPFPLQNPLQRMAGTKKFISSLHDFLIPALLSTSQRQLRATLDLSACWTPLLTIRKDVN